MMAGNALLSPEPIDATRVNPLTPQPTWADAAQNVAANVGGWIADQRAQSEQQGLWGPGGITPAGARQAGTQVGMAPIMGTAGPKGELGAMPGVSRILPRDFVENVHEDAGLSSAVIAPDGSLHELTQTPTGLGAHEFLYQQNPSMASDRAAVRAFPGSIGIRSQTPLTEAQQRTADELSRRYIHLGAAPENIRVQQLATPTK
jgi:hypothetical protein